MYIHWICPITCNSRSTNITIFEQGLQPNHYHPLLQVDSDRPNIYSMSVWLFRHSFVSPSFCGTFQTFVKAGRRFFMGTVAGKSKGSTQHSRQECSSYLLICIPGPGPDRRILFICVCLFCLICIYIYISVDSIYRIAPFSRSNHMQGPAQLVPRFDTVMVYFSICAGFDQHGVRRPIHIAPNLLWSKLLKRFGSIFT